MNYQKIYTNFITNRSTLPLEEGVYYEKHHIIPRAFGGSDSPENLVLLTARDHYFAHLLLAKFAGPKMKIALSWFVNGSNVDRYGKIVPSRTIAQIREDSNTARSEILLGRKFTDQHRSALSASKKGSIPWNKGLTIEDPRVQKNAEKSKETKRLNSPTAWNKGLKGEEYIQHYGKPPTPPCMRGRIWINNGKDQRKIKATEVIPEGWQRGRCDITGDNNPMRKETKNEN